MSENYEMTHIDAVEDSLRIHIGPGSEPGGDDFQPDTGIDIRPPVSAEEHQQLVDSVDSSSDLGRELITMDGSEEGWTGLTMAGAPDSHHMEIGVHLAKEMMAIRGLQAAVIVSEIGGSLNDYLLQQRPAS